LISLLTRRPIRYPFFAIHYLRLLSYFMGYRSLTEHIPSEWELILWHPFNFIPYEILSLWMTHHYLWESNQIGLNSYVSVGVVKTKGNWYFFYDIGTEWLLDYQSFSQTIGLKEYLKLSNYNHYREKLPLVDETNVELYLNFLSNNFIPHNDISRLVYLPSADWHSDKGFTGLRKPPLHRVIDFDERLSVTNVATDEQINLQVEPSSAYLPSDWTCHHNRTLEYLPDFLQQLWDE
jgi:hypothetical protein